MICRPRGYLWNIPNDFFYNPFENLYEVSDHGSIQTRFQVLKKDCPFAKIKYGKNIGNARNISKINYQEWRKLWNFAWDVLKIMFPPTQMNNLQLIFC